MSKSQAARPALELKIARIRLGLHLYEVARSIGVSPARLSQFEGGHRRIPRELDERLRAELGLPQVRQTADGQP